MILVELDTDHSCAIKYNKSVIEIVNPLPVTIFRCHFKLLQEVTALKTPKKLIINFFYNPGQMAVKKLTKLSEIGFLWNVLQLILCEFLTKASKFSPWMSG